MRTHKLGCLASLLCLCGLVSSSFGQPTSLEPTQPDSPLSLQQPPTTPPSTQPPRTTTPPTGAPGTTPRAPTAPAPEAARPQDFSQLASLSENNPPEMLGDMLGRPTIRFFTITFENPPGQLQQRLVPIAIPGRGFKIAENESPRPMDRVYFTYNYYDNVFETQNRNLGNVFHDLRLHREAVGFEKTLFDGMVSLGLRQPLSTLDKGVNQVTFFDLPPGVLAPLAGAETDVGDLSVLLKVAPYINAATGDTLAFGLAVTLPTGESEDPLHATSLEPFVGYIVTFGDWFIHGFTALDIPTKSDDATFLYNDIGLGYYLYRGIDPAAWLTAVVPTVECHVSTPLSDRGGVERRPPPEFVHVGNSDVVDLTFGVNFELFRSMRLATGVAVPVTGPKPFDVEAIVEARLRF